MIRTVFYARVSKDVSIQLHSLEEQRKYFKNYILQHPNYEFIGEYYDEGISGTSLNKRDSFNRMMYDAFNKKFDLILVKDISRFARNTLDTIEQVRKLKEYGVNVIFVNDHLDAASSIGEINLTLMATMAQEESRKISNRVTWTMRNDLKNGVMYLTSIYGYDIKNRQLYINEKEADVVRMMFDLYKEGNGLHLIRKKLHEHQIKSPRGNEYWDLTTIRRILTNEKYIGDLYSGKTQVYDYLTHKRKHIPKSEQYCFKDHHEAIIDKDTFYEVQLLLERKKIQKKSYTKRLFHGKLQCGHCGGNMRYQHPLNYLYLCTNHLVDQTCDNVNTLNMNIMRHMIEDILNDTLIDRNKAKNKVLVSIREALVSSGVHEKTIYLKKKIKNLEKELNYQLDLLMNDKISDDVYKLKQKEICHQLDLLNTEVNQLDEQNSELYYKKSLENIPDKIDGLFKLNSFREEMISRFVDKIVFRNRNDFDLYLNTTNYKINKFDKTNYVFIVELHYDFSKYHIKHTQKKYLNMDDTKVRIYMFGK